MSFTPASTKSESTRARATSGGDFHFEIPPPTPTNTTNLFTSPDRRGLFEVDLFAKSTFSVQSPSTKNNNLHSQKPFVIVIDNDPERTKWYAKENEEEFMSALRSLNILSTATDPSSSPIKFFVDVNFETLTEENFLELCSTLHLHEVTTRDCAIEDTTVTDTKVSLFDSYLFCIVDTLMPKKYSNESTRTPSSTTTTTTTKSTTTTTKSTTTNSTTTNEAEEWETRNLNVILYQHGAVCLHNGAMPGPHDIVRRISRHHRGSVPSSEWIQWAAIDVMLLSLVPLIDVTVSMVDAIDQKSLPMNPEQEIDQSEILRDMRVARRRLSQVRRQKKKKKKEESCCLLLWLLLSLVLLWSR